jgi:two-component system OmpR family sensor kinase
MTSLRRTALIWMTVLLTVVGLAAFAITYEFARQEAADFLDGQLHQIALNAGDTATDIAAPSAPPDPEDQFVIEIWTAAGTVVRRTPNGPEIPRLDHPGHATVQAAGEEWRVYLAHGATRSVQVAQRMSVRQELAESSAIQAGAPILVLIPLSWLVIAWLLGQLSGQLRNLAGDIAKRSLDSRDPVPSSNVPAEVRPLVEGMNVLTGRLQDALERQKRFVADAAHELRTPLMAMQVQLDNLVAGADPHSGHANAELRSGVLRARRLVEQLLRLARSEDAGESGASESIELSDFVTQCVADFVPIAESGGIDLGIGKVEPATIDGSRADLALLFGNLIDNAIRYTPRGGSVDVSVNRVADDFVVEIKDTGCGVSEVDIPRLFDRFFRAAPVDVEGSGLGLSIAAAVAKRHGLSIEIANRSDTKGLIVRVSGKLSIARLIRP